MATAQKSSEDPAAAAAAAAATATATAAATAAVATATAPAVAPIIIIKKRVYVEDDGHGGGHGSSGWKIALADMMTALMSFFLLMWLLGATNEEKRKSIADYFRPTSHSQVTFGELAGSTGMFGGKSIIDTDGFPYTAKQTALLERLTPRAQGGPAAGSGSSQEENSGEGSSEGSVLSGIQQGKREQDQETYERIEKELRKRITESKQFEAIRDQVAVVREKDGLRIDVIDKADFSMFGLGTNEFSERGAALIREVANTIKAVPNRVAIRGHTDSLGFAPDSARTNWSLSAERAEATRQVMQAQGLSQNRFSRIEGVADTNPSIPGNPADPRNRRVSITVLNL